MEKSGTQITILGMSGAGKTCYLLGLYYKMSAGMKGYTITSDEDTDVQLRDRYAKLCDVTLEKEKRFPAGTDNITKYSFDLQYGYNTIMSFEWLDYPGGLLDRKNTGNLEEYEGLKNAINNSSSLFICVDGSLLKGDSKDEKIDAVRDNCSNVINTFFSDYFKNNHVLPPTAIIVTKYDLCREDTDEKELCDIIKESFSPFFTDTEIEKIVTIIPVSIGISIGDDNYAGKMKPLNIHLPIFMGIWFALIKEIQKYAKTITENEKELQRKVENLKVQKNQKDSKWFFKSKNEIVELVNLIQKFEKEGMEKSKQLKYLLNAAADNSNKIKDELETIKHVFVNGRETSFNEIVKAER